jgi:hypothetical protein
MNSSRDRWNTKSSCVLAVAALARVAAVPAAAFRPRNAVTGHVFPVSRQHVLAVADAAVVEGGFRDVLAGHAHFAALLEVRQLAVAHHAANGFLHLGLVAAQEPLAVHRVLATVVEATIDEMSHSVSSEGPPRGTDCAPVGAASAASVGVHI